MNRHVIISGALFMLMAVALGVLVWRDLAPTGQFSVDYDLIGYNPWISKVFPEGRLSAPHMTREGWERVVEAEPLYITMRLPRAMSTVRIRLWYRTQNAAVLNIGLQRQPRTPIDTWHYDFHEAAATSVADGAWQLADETFDLNGAMINDHRLRFMLSSPGLKPSALRLHKVSIAVQGEALNASSFLTSLQRAVWRILL